MDLEKLCGKFALLKDPDAHVYSGVFKNHRPHTLVVVREQGTDKATVLYAYGSRPDRDRDREGCLHRKGQFDDNVLTVRLRKNITVTYTFDGDQVAVEFRRTILLKGELTAE